MRQEKGEAGAFVIPVRVQGKVSYYLKIIASNGEGWEHVSVSIFSHENKTPTWGNMCLVKNMFWDEEECVVQYHPPKSEYVNHHPGCLHLWRKIGFDYPTPPAILVGPKSDK